MQLVLFFNFSYSLYYDKETKLLSSRITSLLHLLNLKTIYQNKDKEFLTDFFFCEAKGIRFNLALGGETRLVFWHP